MPNIVRRFLIVFSLSVFMFKVDAQFFTAIDFEIGVRNSVDVNKGKFKDDVIPYAGGLSTTILDQKPSLQQNYFMSIGVKIREANRIKLSLSYNDLYPYVKTMINTPNSTTFFKFREEIKGHYFALNYERLFKIKNVGLWLSGGFAYEEHDYTEAFIFFNGLDWHNWAIQGGIATSMIFFDNIELVPRVNIHNSLSNRVDRLAYKTESRYLPLQIGVDFGFRYTLDWTRSN